MSMPAFQMPDATMSDQDFDQLRQIIYSCSGIVIGPEKRSMMRARLRKRMSTLNLSSLGEYLKLISGGLGSAEREMFISCLTTNFTSFFRESHHFTLLTEEILPGLAESARRIDIWSAGCSSGQEPYSIAMSILDRWPGLAPQVRILASDIDASILDKAKAGVFKAGDLGNLRLDQRARHFQPVRRAEFPGDVRVNANLSAMIDFRQINLNAAWALGTQFDVIFFRNVAIYFDQNTQCSLWRKFQNALRPGGWLLIGHSERIPTGFHDILRPSGTTTYRRPN